MPRKIHGSRSHRLVMIEDTLEAVKAVYKRQESVKSSRYFSKFFLGFSLQRPDSMPPQWSISRGMLGRIQLHTKHTTNKNHDPRHVTTPRQD
eukprot:TRINITY_DN12149_c0_g1_i1.p1 TRINITY_DN12149_c0_g1~~TRINITY_DN12149_c0_g1_i1.p1  ORF type:complete len:92 (+),score=1.82 TRINITY_DN12149_c0_g1_i1:183-458(+)